MEIFRLQLEGFLTLFWSLITQKSRLWKVSIAPALGLSRGGSGWRGREGDREGDLCERRDFGTNKENMFNYEGIV
jgi:hypothetical protein